VGESGLKTNKTALFAFVFIVFLLVSHFAVISVDQAHLIVQAESVRVFENVIVDSIDYASAVSAGDVDGDGFADVIAAKIGAGLSWFRYPNWNEYSIGSFDWRSEEIKCVDIDADGDLDVVGAQDSNNKVYWFENPRPNGNPKGTWASHYIGNCRYGFISFGVADFNNDGKLDVVARADAYFGKGETSIFVQNQSSWSTVKTVPTRSHDGLDVGDLDGDLDADIVLNGFWLENPYPDISGTWSEHNIDNKWWNQTTDNWTNGWADNNARTVVVDLNKDGRLDILLSHSEKPGYPISWYETSNPRNGSWIEHVIGYVDYCHTLLVGDMNLDGYLDVVASKFERSDGLFPPPFPIKVYYNNGNSLSWNETAVSDFGVYKGVLGDIGTDGDLDIIGSRGYLKPPVEIWINSPTPTSTPTPTATPTPTVEPTPRPERTHIARIRGAYTIWI
jgi:hypothetical protein